MKHLAATLLGATALLGVSAAAFAADLPVKAPVAPAYTAVQAPVFSWTGFYLGANVGYGWASDGATGFSSDLNGVIGGGQIGYNWQTGPLVLGIEADIQGSGQHHSDTGVIGGTTFTVDRKIPWFTTLRGRIGYSTGPLLFYFTGGGAWLDYELSTTSGGTTVSDHTTSTAWTVGGGVEWMFAPKWSTKVEYLYLDGRDASVTLGGTTFTGRARDNIIRAGLNYHF